jgi:heme exporter protein B
MTGQPRRVSAFSHYRVLLAKDLAREFRTHEMLSSMGTYALLVLVVFGAALAQTTAKLDIAQISGGLIWMLVIFTSLLGLNRSFAYEKEDGALEGILLVPMDRGIIYLSKATANLLFLLAVEVVALPLFYFFFLSGVTPAATLPLVVWPLLIGTIGTAGIGTLLATITSATRGRELLLALLFIPLAFPLLYACVAATTFAIVGGEDIMGIWLPPFALAVGYDIVMLLASWVLYGFVVAGQ